MTTFVPQGERELSGDRQRPGWEQPDYINEPLYVVTVIFNPLRFKSRWKLYQRFAHMVKAAGATLVTVEATFGERAASLKIEAPNREVVSSELQVGWPVEHRYYKVQTESEIWLKENLLNLAVQRLPRDWKYVAWVDADVAFARPNWVSETIHQLQHYGVVQMFTEAYDLRPDYTIHARLPGFVEWWHNGQPIPADYYGGSMGTLGCAPGFAWAARRDAWDHFGGLLDTCVAGSADYHMACAFIGNVQASLQKRAAGMHPGYVAPIREFGFRCDRHIRENVGAVSGALFHSWHGKKVQRGYGWRGEILVKNQFNPAEDLKRDWQGLWQLVDRGDKRSISLRDGLMRYFRSRNEDSIDVE